MYFHPEETIRAFDKMGIRGFVSQPELDLIEGGNLEKSKEKVNDFIKIENPNENRIFKGISCHSVHSSSDKFLKFYSNLAKEHNMYLHIHACETQKEINDCKRVHKCSPIEYLNSFDLLTNKTILAHCVHVIADGNDLNLIKEKVCKIGKILKKCP